ncbi:RNA methyltransferase [Pseudochryseolinea flava]|uniref:RNA methyltransferase n=2 Tax=Pseudochryseolinea flava TaxID=2059302 RepID=A0A364XZE5_9BACT|nr:RNA methyltransferase [Pseudochryseolinea flava]
MLSKAKIKFIKSLQLKKYRKQEQCFVVQGAKSVHELLLSDFEIQFVLGTTEFLDAASLPKGLEIIAVQENELAGLSEFQTNDAALAVARMKPNTPVKIAPGEFALVLDDIRDPGNLGTIIRTADWFGISKIIASEETADIYNAKVISATMGSFVRVEMYYTALTDYLQSIKLPVYGAYLDGADVHTQAFHDGGFVVIGNESRGISPEIGQFITQKITIPQYGKAESLNAAIATAIICDNIRRPK